MVQLPILVPVLVTGLPENAGFADGSGGFGSSTPKSRVETAAVPGVWETRKSSPKSGAGTGGGVGVSSHTLGVWEK